MEDLVVYDVDNDEIKWRSVVSEEFTLEKMRINERLGGLENKFSIIEGKIDTLIDSSKNTSVILTGNGHPENGTIYRVSKLEEFKTEVIHQKQDRDKQIIGAITIGLTAIAGVVGDVVSRALWNHK